MCSPCSRLKRVPRWVRFAPIWVVAEATFYRGKERCGGLGVSEIRRLKQLEDENRRLKQLVADLTLDKAMLQDVLRIKP